MNFSSTDTKQWSRLGPRAMFGKFMLDIAKKNKKLIVLSADLGRSSGLARFKIEFPKQYISIGISEQNLIGVASGLANEGYKVFVTSFAPFLSILARFATPEGSRGQGHEMCTKCLDFGIPRASHLGGIFD